MTDEPIRWTGDATRLSGWQRDLFDYMRIVGPASVAIGNFPEPVLAELAAWDSGPPANTRAIEVLVMMLVITQQLAGHTEGVIARAMVTAWRQASWLSTRSQRLPYFSTLTIPARGTCRHGGRARPSPPSWPTF